MKHVLLLYVPLFSLCYFITNAQQSNIKSLKFIGEYILNKDIYVNDKQVGGLSGIDYKEGKWIAICDDSNSPRYYDLDIQYTNTSFTKVEVKNSFLFKDYRVKLLPAKHYDPESIRFIVSDRFIWSSEGSIKNNYPTGISLSFFDENATTFDLNEIKLPKANYNKYGPRHNGAIEALSYYNEHIWYAYELPLIQDGKEPTFEEHGAPIRIADYDYNSKKLKQYAYSLGKVALKKKKKKSIALNGVVEILNINETELLVLERSYTSGYDDGGTHVKLFKVTIAPNSTNISEFKSLKGQEYNLLQKELLLDFNTIKNEFPSKHVDNIEGMCWGPNLKDGSKTLVFVADNNFNLYGKQLNQFLAFKVSSKK